MHAYTHTHISVILAVSPANVDLAKSVEAVVFVNIVGAVNGTSTPAGSLPVRQTAWCASGFSK